MNKWIELTRPKTLLTGLAPVLMSYAFLLKNHREIDNTLSILTFLCVILLQIGTNLANDLYDGIRGIDNEKRIGPRRSTATGEINVKDLKIATYLVFFIAFIIGSIISFFAGFEIFIIGLISLLVAFAYTGGPFPLSYYALGELLAFLFFGPVAICGTYYIQAQEITKELIIISCIPGLFSAALMSLNNYRDIYTDKNTQKKTLATTFGLNSAKFITLGMIFLGLFISILFLEYNLYYKFPSILLTILSITFIFKTPHGKKLNKGLGLISFSNFIWCLSSFIIYWIKYDSL